MVQLPLKVYLFVLNEVKTLDDDIKWNLRNHCMFYGYLYLRIKRWKGATVGYFASVSFHIYTKLMIFSELKQVLHCLLNAII